MSKIKVFMGIPGTGTRADFQCYAMRQLERDYGDKIEFVYPKDMVQRKFHDFARNAVVEDFLATDCDILWFLDSDVVPPANVLDLVTKHHEKWICAGAAYPVQLTPKGSIPTLFYTIYRNVDGKLLHAESLKGGGTEYVDGLATGCLFLKRSVFELLSKPYFEFKYDPETRCMTEGEDLGFCRKVNQLGFQFFTDHGMICRHYKQVDLVDMNQYAVAFANEKLKAYDAQIRGQILELEKRVRGKVKPKSNLILPSHLSDR